MQPVGTPCLPQGATVSSQEHTGRSLSQNILFRQLASHQQSRMLIWEQEDEMWPQVSACLQAPRRKFEEAAEAAAGSQHGRQSWVGWRPGQLVCAACAVSSSAGCGAARYRGFSSYNTKGSARLASAEVRRKCIMLTVYFALIGFRPSF